MCTRPAAFIKLYEEIITGHRRGRLWLPCETGINRKDVFVSFVPSSCHENCANRMADSPKNAGNVVMPWYMPIRHSSNFPLR